MTFDPAALDSAELDRATLEIDFLGRLPAWRRGITAAALMAKHFEPVNYVVPGLLAEGVTLFGGKPKIGKIVRRGLKVAPRSSADLAR